MSAEEFYVCMFLFAVSLGFASAGILLLVLLGGG